MSDQKQRDRWASHIEDERQAVDLQQAAAGDTHRPAEGPLPYTHDNLADAVTQAVLSERERCAAVVQSWTSEDRVGRVMPELTPEQRRLVILLASRIAQDVIAPPGP